MKKLKKLRIGKRYWLDSVKDVSGLFVGEDQRGHYLFRGLTNNSLYLNDKDGNVPMPADSYERCDDITVIF